MKRLLFCLTFLLITAAGGGVFAHTLDAVAFNAAAGTVTVSGTVTVDPALDMNDVTVQVLTAGKSFGDGFEATAGNWSEVYNTVWQIRPARDGAYAADIPIKEEFGLHQVRVVFSDGTSAYGSFVCMTAEETSRFIQDINAASTAESMKTALLKYDYAFKDLALTRELAVKFPNEDITGKIAACMAGQRYADAAAVTAGYDAGAVTVLVNLSGAGEEIRAALAANAALVGLPGDKLYDEIYGKLSKSAQATLCDGLKNKGFANAAALKRAFFEAVILDVVNRAGNWGDVGAIIKLSGGYLDITKYTALTGDLPQGADKAIVKLTPFSGWDSFVSVFNAAVSAANGNGSSASNGGGGGGGGGSSSTVTSNPSAPIYIGEPPATVSFNDLAGVAWAETAINTLALKGIVNGRGDGVFDPNGNVTREEFSKMLALALNLSGGAACPFEDVADWSRPYVAALYHSGVVKGVSETMFNGAGLITREDMAVMAHRAIGGGTAASEPFADDGDLFDYAREGVYFMRGKGIINGVGDNRFAPKDFSTRAEAAKIIYGLMESEGVL